MFVIFEDFAIGLEPSLVTVLVARKPRGGTNGRAPYIPQFRG